MTRTYGAPPAAFPLEDAVPRLWNRPIVHAIVSIVLLSGIVAGTGPAAAQGDNAGLTSETTYESPSYGYEIAWEDPWTAGTNAATSEDETDTLELTTEAASLGVIGTRADPTASRPPVTGALLDSIREITQVDPDWTIVASDPAGPAPSLVIDYEDGGVAVRQYIEVREVADGDAVVTITLVAEPDAFETALEDAREAVTLDDAPILAGGARESFLVTDEAATPEAEATADDLPTATATVTQRATEEDDATAEAEERDVTATPTETPEVRETPTEATETEVAAEGPPHGQTTTRGDTGDTGDTGDDGNGIEGNTYTSPQYDYTLTWDEDEWEAASASSDEETGYDSIRLLGEFSIIEIRSDPDYQGDPLACREDWADILRAAEGVEEFQPLEDAAGDAIADENDDTASAAYAVTLTTETGDTFNVVDYVECQVLVPRESNVVIIHSTLREDYDDQVEVREDLLAGLELPNEATDETPEAGETPTPRETPADTAAAADYTSPTFGYALSWDQEWTVVREDSADSFDTLELTNGVSRVFIEGQEDFEGDPRQCLNDAVAEARAGVGIADFEPMRDDEGRRVTGFQSGRAYAAYTLIYTEPNGGEPTEYVEYLECRTLAEGESVLEITQIVPAADYEAESAALEELLANLDLAET